MDDMEFSSLSELYKRVTPALNTKVDELRRNNYTYIKSEDIWNYLKEHKWIRAYNLTLADIVDDILNCSNVEIDRYVKDKMKHHSRTAYFDNLDNLL